MRNCESDPKAFIEIFIKSKAIEEKDSKTPSGMKTARAQNVALPAIEENNNDFEVREEFERLEEEY